jgi:hypothetical protein
MPLPVLAGVGGVEPDGGTFLFHAAFYFAEQLVEERETALLAIGDDVKPAPFLERDGLVHGAVLDLLELAGG